MGLLKDIDETLQNGYAIMDLIQEQESLIADLLIPGSANRIITDLNFSKFLKVSLEKASFPLLSAYKKHEIVSLDCRNLTKGYAYGWMKSLSEKIIETHDLIVVIEHITEIPYGLQCDDVQYIENLIGHSWKNEMIYLDDCQINRRNLTVILTSISELQEELGRKYRMDSYSWYPDFDKEIERIVREVEKLS